jgi:hypothetical protein
MPIRNPFTRRPGAAADENIHPDRDASSTPGFERIDTVGSKASSVLSIRSNKSQDTGEYKMSGMCSQGPHRTRTRTRLGCFSPALPLGDAVTRPPG